MRRPLASGWDIHAWKYVRKNSRLKDMKNTWSHTIKQITLSTIITKQKKNDEMGYSRNEGHPLTGLDGSSPLHFIPLLFLSEVVMLFPLLMPLPFSICVYGAWVLFATQSMEKLVIGLIDSVQSKRLCSLFVLRLFVLLCPFLEDILPLYLFCLFAFCLCSWSCNTSVAPKGFPIPQPQSCVHYRYD